METAVANQQPDDLKRAAHSLKSNSAHFGLMTLSARARTVEMQAKSGDITNVNTLLADVQAAYAETVPVLNAYLSE
jgi:HPt (histidine-containing phosphotransfer) domain-containing protein